MKIGLIDVDSHNFPNLPLMKISAYHKQKGDIVKWYEPFDGLAEIYDKVYISKIFSFTKDYEYPIYAKEIEKGGSGYCISVKDGKEIFDNSKNINLPYEIEHIYPDYSIYPDLTKNTAFGFLTRGCPRGCEFCHVKSKEGKKSYKVADLSEFWRGQKNIVLLDPNILACKEHIDLLKQLEESKAEIEFNQGIDVRLINEKNISILKKLKLKNVHIAYDDYKQKDIIENKMILLKQETNLQRKNIMVYILVNFDTTLEEDLHRIYFCKSLNFQPFPMIYNKQNCAPIYKKLQRWCNGFIFWKVPTFEEYLNIETKKSENQISIEEII